MRPGRFHSRCLAESPAHLHGVPREVAHGPGLPDEHEDPLFGVRPRPHDAPHRVSKLVARDHLRINRARTSHIQRSAVPGPTRGVGIGEEGHRGSPGTTGPAAGISAQTLTVRNDVTVFSVLPPEVEAPELHMSTGEAPRAMETGPAAKAATTSAILVHILSFSDGTVG